MTHKKKTIYSFALLIIALVGAFFVLSRNSSVQIFSEYMRYDTETISLGSKEIEVYLADNPRIRTRGLSNKSSLPEDKGMLFVFEEPGKYSFWMKDMNFAIDMIWMDQNGKVVFVQKNATPESYPTLFVTDKDALYVLEVNAGWADENRVREGSVFEINF